MKTVLEIMAEISDKALILFEAGEETKESLLSKLQKPIEPNVLTAIDVAWRLYQIKEVSP
jgi:hypothetical protein